MNTSLRVCQVMIDEEDVGCLICLAFFFFFRKRTGIVSNKRMKEYRSERIGEKDVCLSGRMNKEDAGCSVC